MQDIIGSLLRSITNGREKDGKATYDTLVEGEVKSS